MTRDPAARPGPRPDRRRFLGLALGLVALLAVPARRAIRPATRLVRPAGPRGPAIRVRPLPEGGFTLGRDLAG